MASAWLLARMGIYTRTLLKYGQNIKCCWAVKIDSVEISNQWRSGGCGLSKGRVSYKQKVPHRSRK